MFLFYEASSVKHEKSHAVRVHNLRNFVGMKNLRLELFPHAYTNIRYRFVVVCHHMNPIHCADLFQVHCFSILRVVGVMCSKHGSR